MTAWLAGLLLWLAAAFSAQADDRAPMALADPAQQILVMLPMAPEHYRSGNAYSGAYGDLLGRSARHRLAVKLAQEHGLTLASGWPMPALGVECFVMNLPAAQTGGPLAVTMAMALGRDPRVAWAQPMNVYRAQAHDDPLFAVQPAASAWHLAELHQVATGRGVRIAIIDSGIERDHPDLAGQIDDSADFVAGRRFVAERHGTEVAGIVAAVADNHLGMVGVAPRARLLALRACWQDDKAVTSCTSLSLAQALDHAIAHRAQIINLSLSGPQDPLLARLLDLALGRGIAVVVAVDRTLRGGGFPASHPGVLAVADQESGAAEPAMLLAPGRDVPATGPPKRWYLVTGSSFAAAHVSGLLALLREAGTSRAMPVADASGDALVRLPSGAIDACASLMRRVGPCACACATADADAPGKRP